MCLATCSLEGKPSCRIVLAQSINEDGFIFFTNYNSKKAQELDSNPQASVCFYWDQIQKQVIMDGTVRKITREESKNYFESRDVDTQICFLVSEQGKVLKHKRVSLNNFLQILYVKIKLFFLYKHLLQKKENAQKEFEKCEAVPYPKEWYKLSSKLLKITF
jgi:pyridoxine/pyridoxamine 5'-phosphate oxidase